VEPAELCYTNDDKHFQVKCVGKSGSKHYRHNELFSVVPMAFAGVDGGSGGKGDFSIIETRQFVGNGRTGFTVSCALTIG
jgi:hypothetical protein